MIRETIRIKNNGLFNRTKRCRKESVDTTTYTNQETLTNQSINRSKVFGARIEDFDATAGVIMAQEFVNWSDPPKGDFNSF